MVTSCRRPLTIAALLLLVVPRSARGAQKTDIKELVNGGRITCEIS